MATAKKTQQRTAARQTPQSARDKAYLALQQKMLSGEFPAGSPVSEASLARELGISRTPLREAIGQLIAQGFLRPVPNRGTVHFTAPVFHSTHRNWATPSCRPWTP